MQRYIYSARDDETQKMVKSVVQANSEQDAAKVLLEMGLRPLEIHEEKEGNVFSTLRQRITGKDKVTFTRSLATLVGAGLPLAQSLSTIVDQTQNSKMRKVVQDILVSIEAGRPLGDAFAAHPDVFDQVYLALIRAGEASGTLEQALRRIADQQEKDAAISSKIRGAMYYPSIVLLVIVGVVVFMMVTIVPQVSQLYAGLGRELPVLTKILVATSDIIVRFWPIMLLVIGGAVLGLRQYSKTEAGVRTMDILKLNAPIMKGMFRKLYMARLVRTGETLLSTGVPMLDMLSITSEAVNNTYVAASIKAAEGKVRGGTELSKSLRDEEYIDLLVPQMISIGEQSGQIDSMMGKLAKVYEDELDEQLQAISTIIEPILMVVMGVFAGGIVMAILFPIYSLVSASGI